MIATDSEYSAVRQQAHELWDWWSRIDTNGDPLTVSNIHRRLAALHREMAEYQARCLRAAPEQHAPAIARGIDSDRG